MDEKLNVLVETLIQKTKKWEMKWETDSSRGDEHFRTYKTYIREIYSIEIMFNAWRDCLTISIFRNDEPAFNYTKENNEYTAKMPPLLLELYECARYSYFNGDEAIDVIIEELTGNKPEADNPILLKGIRDCGFSTRVANGLVYNDINTVGDLVKVSDGKELLYISYFGHKCLSEVKQFLKDNNLSFGMNSSNS